MLLNISMSEMESFESLTSTKINKEFYLDDDEINTTNETFRLVKFINQSEYDFNFQTYLNVRNFFTWLSLTTGLIGLVGNFFSFIVLINPKMRTTTNIFLANLCLSSFIALACLLFNSIFYEITFYYGPETFFNSILRIYPYVYPIANTFQMACIMLTVCVSFNQFLCIYYSRVRNYSKMSTKAEYAKTIKVVLIVYILSGLYCIPYWLKFTYNSLNGLHPTRLGQNKDFNRIVHFWLWVNIYFYILVLTHSIKKFCFIFFFFFNFKIPANSLHHSFLNFIFYKWLFAHKVVDC